MSIGERISDLRKHMNMSQGQLAEAMGVTRQAVSKWENDLAVPDALKMIRLADILDSDLEFLSTGRRNFARCPPVVLTETKVVEKVVEKPVIQIKTEEKIIEVPTIQYVDKTVLKHVYRTKYRRNPIELLLTAIIAFFIGLLIGLFL